MNKFISACIISASVVFSLSVNGQSTKRPKTWEMSPRSFNWERYDYYYGPDGYYSRVKAGKEKGTNWGDLRYYKSGRKSPYPVFKKARYTEDRRGRGFLYPDDAIRSNN